MKTEHLIFAIVGVFVILFLFMKKSATTLAPVYRGSTALQTNSNYVGSSILAGDLGSFFGGFLQNNNNQSSNAPAFVGGGSPSILNVTPSPSSDYSSPSTSLLGDNTFLDEGY